jgi:hypothetical protein
MDKRGHKMNNTTDEDQEDLHMMMDELRMKNQQFSMGMKEL